MVNQVIRNLSVFNLTEKEKKLFYEAVNKLSREVYERKDKNSGLFLEAIKGGNAEEAFILIQGLSWRYLRLRFFVMLKELIS